MAVALVWDVAGGGDPNAVSKAAPSAGGCTVLVERPFLPLPLPFFDLPLLALGVLGGVALLEPLPRPLGMRMTGGAATDFSEVVNDVHEPITRLDPKVKVDERFMDQAFQVAILGL